VPDQDFSGTVVPGLRPLILRPEGGGDGGLPDAEALPGGFAGWVPPAADLADALFGGGAEALAAVRSRQRVCDACFADGLWRADSPPSSGQALVPAAVAALGLLAGHRAVQQAEADERTGRRSLI
jgi:hypothetical protein